MTALEAVARAICECEWPLAWPEGGSAAEVTIRANYTEKARAAREAFAANVTDEMASFAYNELHDDFTGIPIGVLKRAIEAAIRAAD